MFLWFAVFGSTTIFSSPTEVTSKKPVTRRRQIVEVAKMVCLIIGDRRRISITSGSGSSGSTVPIVYRKASTPAVSTIVRVPLGNAHNGALDVKGKPETGQEDAGIFSTRSTGRART